MKVYCVTDDKGDGAYSNSFTGTLGEAHAEAKDIDNRVDARIDEYDIDTSKAAIIAILNDGLDLGPLTPVNTWGLSPRGGLRKLKPGD